MQRAFRVRAMQATFSWVAAGHLRPDASDATLRSHGLAVFNMLFKRYPELLQ
jgi:hypothetical protein